MNGTSSPFSVSSFHLTILIVLILFLIYNSSSGYALIIGTLFSDKQLAVTLTPVLIIPFMLFAGFFVNQDNIPKFLIPFEYLSIFKYGYQALMQNEYEDLDLPCMHEKEISKSCAPLQEFRTPNMMYVTGSTIALGVMYVGCYLISLMIMKSLSKKYE
jgi:hypothetical protein